VFKQFSGGSLSSNTYVVYNENKNSDGVCEGMVIDTGNPVAPIKEFAEKNSICIKYIVLTHGHYDHVCYIEDYRAVFPTAKVVCHEAESKVLLDTEANVSYLFGDPTVYRDADIKVQEGSVLSLCGFFADGAACDMLFTVMNTPGHTPGCICLYNEADKLMFTGDTLFAGGYGRTDFKYGNGAELMVSLRRLLSMDEDISFYSGHGEMSKIGWERY